MSKTISIDYIVQQKTNDGRWVSMPIKRPTKEFDGLYTTPRRGVAHARARDLNPPTRVLRVETTIDIEIYSAWVEE